MEPVRIVDRYLLHAPIASGGIATVHFGRLGGPHGFSRVVAIKRLHPQLASDPDLVASLLDEARLASKVRHPNVVPTLDVVTVGSEPLVVMEYVHGDSLVSLIRAALRRGEKVPPAIAVAIVRDTLRGLHAAHEARDETGLPLRIVHRDVSPQNILVGVDGVARIVDFGVAKAVGRLQVTREGEVKGKAAYMAPEQLLGSTVGPRADVYGASVVLWETLVGKRLFRADNDPAVVLAVMTAAVDPPSALVAGIPPALDDVVLRGLSRDAAARFESARAMADALEAALAPAPIAEVASFVADLARDTLAERSARLLQLETLEAPASLDAATSATKAPASLDAAAPAAKARSRRWLLAAMAALSLAVVVGYVAMQRSHPAATTNDAPTTSAIAPSASSLAAPIVSPSAVSSGPVASADVPSPASAPSLASAPKTTASKPKLPPAPTKKPPSLKESCKPPYTIDAQGHKHWKPDCL